MKKVIIIFTLLFSNIFAEEKIAIATKIIGNALYIRGDEGESKAEPLNGAHHQRLCSPDHRLHGAQKQL